MNVLIVESPGKVKAINKYLGSNYKVLASFGHIRDLPSKDGSVKPDDDFAMTWEVEAKGAKSGVSVLSSLQLMQGATKVYETPLVKATAVNVQGRDAVAMELDVPLNGLKPGQYVCQLNVIDDAGGSFAFPRFAVLVREPAAQAAPSGSGGR